MGRVRRLLIGSAGALAGYASGKVLLRGGNDRGVGLVLPGEDELLGSVRGRPEIVRGPRSSRIYTERFESDGARGTILFTHGWCVTEAIWHYQKRDLGGGPHRVLTWDLPGHGHSTQIARGHLSIDIAVDALAKVVDTIPGDEPLVLVGHSLGGVLTLGYLLRHSETARRRVRGAVLAATPLVHFARSVAGRWPGATVPSRVVGGVAQLAVQNGVVDRYFAREAGRRATRDASYRLIRAGFGDRPDPAQVRFVRDMAASIPPSVRADTFRAMTGFDLRPRLGELETPMVLAVGGRDHLVNADEVHEFGPLIPGVRIEEFRRSGHALFLEEHERFTGLVREMAAERLAGPRRRTAPGPRRSARRAPRQGAAAEGANQGAPTLP